MTPNRLDILFLSQMPASPARFGAQARIQGLMRELAHRHNLTAVMLVDEEFDIAECRAAMREYCQDVELIPNPRGRAGLAKRWLQLQSMGSASSWERLRVSVPEVQRTLDRLMRERRFDIVNLEFTFLGHNNLRQSPPGNRKPALVIDSHNIDYDLARQYARSAGSLLRRVYAEVNWRKLRREELATYGKANGVALCSGQDQHRLLDQLPHLNTIVIPNAADVDYYQPSASDVLPDNQTVVFFGLLSYQPNIDGVIHFIEDIWPRITKANPQARLTIIGGSPPPSLTAMATPQITFTGFVPDLRPHLANAAVVIVPLRLGGGTRLKIVEAMAMGKAIVSTALGAEGIEAVQDRDILIADEPNDFADCVNRLLTDPDLAQRLGKSARKLAESKYAWNAAAKTLEDFYRSILEKQRA